MQPVINVTLTGQTIPEIISGAQRLIATLEKTGGTKRAAVTAVDEDDQLDMSSDDEEVTDTDDSELSFDDEEEVAAPAKKASTTKGNGKSKIALADVNKACKAYAAEHGKAKTLKVLSNC